jgi:hypothetical protein
MGVESSKIVISQPQEEEEKEEKEEKNQRFQEKRARLRREYEQERAQKDPLEPFYIKKAQEERVRAYHQKLRAYYQRKIADLEREGDNPETYTPKPRTDKEISCFIWGSDGE